MIKGNTNENDLKDFINTVTSEIKGLGIQDDNSSLLFMKLDTRTMKIEGYNFGEHQMISSQNFSLLGNTFPVDFNFSDKAMFSHQLARDEKLYLVSKGIIQNAQKAKIPLEQVIKPSESQIIEEEFNEIFFQLKKNNASRFMEHDATMVLLKVDKNAIFSI